MKKQAAILASILALAAPIPARAQAVRGTPREAQCPESIDAARKSIARFIIDGIVVENDRYKTIELVDAHNDLDQPVARNMFLPNIPALAWQPQPVVIGAVASVPALPVNSDGTALWLADAPIAENPVARGADGLPLSITRPLPPPTEASGSGPKVTKAPATARGGGRCAVG